MASDGQKLRAELPEASYQRQLISCQQACPVGTDARGYVRAIAEGRFDEAYLIARGPNPFASICGRICGAPCEAACRRGRIPRTDADGRFVGLDRPIAIRALKRFACDAWRLDERSSGEILEALRQAPAAVCAGAEEMAALLRAKMEGRFEPAKGERVAIIGAGPAGLSAAHDLALLGLRPIVYEIEPEPAGMLAYGVPEYRLPRDLIRREVDVIRALGVEIHCGVEVGKDISFKEVRDRSSALILTVGAKRPRSLGLPGEQGPGSFGGVDFLRAVARGEALELGERVVVIGGGNVAYDVARTVVRQTAYDAARTAARLAPHVDLVSLETLDEMPADTIEIVEGDEEGIVRHNGWGPIAIERDAHGRVKSVEFQRCLKVYDDERRFAPQFRSDERMTLPCDAVLLAAGQATDLSFLEHGGEDVEQFRPGWPKVDSETLASSADGVFVAGDLAYGPRLLIDAVASGKRAARSVYSYLTGRTLGFQTLDAHFVFDPAHNPYAREHGYEQLRRVPIPTARPETRLESQATQVELGYNREQAMEEASRCLDCSITPVFDGLRCVLCGGCAEVCPTLCLKIVPLEVIDVEGVAPLPLESIMGSDGSPSDEACAILKDEDFCIRCGLCALRCPVEAISMEGVRFETLWEVQ